MKGLSRVAWPSVVFAIALAVFSVSVTRSHLALDDWGYVYGCPFVKDGLSWANVRAAFTTLGHGGIWMPLTYMTYMADISAFGQGWIAHHAVNVVLHAINAVLLLHFVAAVAGRLLPEGRGVSIAACAVATLLWACSPVRAEAVAWVASRKEELWTLFALCGIMAWVRWLEKGRLAFYAASLVFFALASLSKPTAMCLAPLALIVHALVVGKTRRVGFYWYLPVFAIAAATGAIAIFSQTHPEGAAPVEIYTAPFWWRLLNAAVASGVYLLQSAVPYGVYFDWREVPGGWPLWSAAGLAALALAIAALVMVLRRAADRGLRRIVLLAALWFAASLLPVLGIFGAVGDNALACRYAYLPSMAVAAVAAYVLSAVKRPRVRAASLFAATALAAANAALAANAARSFENDETLAERTLKCDPDNWRALRTLGRTLAAREGRMDEGIDMLKRSLALRRSQLTADSLAYLLACRGADGDFDEVRRMAKAVRKRPGLDRSGMMHDALGVVEMREGDWELAAKDFSASLVAPERTYTNIHTMLNLGLSLANAGKRADAVLILVKLRGVADRQVRDRALEALDVIKSRRPCRFEWR